MHRPDPAKPIERRVVLIGAGNAHLLFVRRWGMKPQPGVAVTLVNDTSTVPYSAMVPGFIAGEYRRDEVTIDLIRLCPANGVRLIAEPVARIDSKENRIHFADRPPIGYEILSLGLGSVPQLPPGAKGQRWSFQLRPLGKLIDQLDSLDEHLRTSPQPFRLAVVGGGASGCELALAIRKRITSHNGFSITLIHAGERLLQNFPSRSAQIFEEQLQTQGITVRRSARALGIENGNLQLDRGEAIPCDGVLWATDPAPPTLLRQSGLSLDQKGFLPVRESLQALSNSNVFGTGDCVSLPAYPNLPRNGVMAVRQGHLLFKNILSLINNRQLRAFRPQKLWLSLLNISNGAVATYGPVSTWGRWPRRWKDRIDRRWMRMFDPPLSTDSAEAQMRCGGCGSKVPGDVLMDTLKQLDLLEDPRIVMGCRDGEDAAVFRTASVDTVEVQTVDYFKSFIDDPFLFGQVAALHAVSDLHAMNARPFAALAIATVPFARRSIQGEQLNEMMAGAAAAFRQMGVVLAGGHTTEGAELALGFTVTGDGDARRLFRKAGLRPRDHLILTKPLGTGALLAAWMRGHCRAEWFQEATKSMLISNATAAKVFNAAGVTACTDVTGFGLAGHLLEMLDASKVSARIEPDAVPRLAGFAEVVEKGIVSTLQEGNARNACRITSTATLPAWLFDPQTSGGLLAGVRPEVATEVIRQLREAGLPRAAVIGEVVETGDETPIILHVQ